MSKFKEWVAEAAYDVVGDEAEAMEAAFEAGMLAAADIAELSQEYILFDSSWHADVVADLIATQIRNYANEPSNERP